MIVTHSFMPDTESCGLKTTATLGTFDGVHEGHRKLIGRLVKVAKETKTDSAVLTFNDHPLTILHPEVAPSILTTLDEKLELFEKLGVDRVFVLKFTKEIAEMPSDVFIERYLVHCLGISYFIAGYDHHFGSDKLQSEEKLRSLSETHDFTVEIVPPVLKEKEAVKSSTIRELLYAGNVKKASLFLGDSYSFSGVVVKGREVGRKLGYPTANILPIHTNKCIPHDGVYAGWVLVSGEYHDAVISVGPIPTFGVTERLIEVHIPGFERNIYDHEIRVGFTDRIRDIICFKNETDLVKQIKHDIVTTNRIIQK